MNQIQEAIARVTGVSEELQSTREAYLHELEGVEENQKELMLALSSLESQNALLQREIEDLDYVNLFDLNHITEVIPLRNRKQHYHRLRTMRQHNPLAKQSVKLITRFTLGKGVQISIGPDPEKELEAAAEVPAEDPEAGGPDKINGLFPGPSQSAPKTLPPLPRKRPQISEEVEPAEDDQLKEIVDSFWNDDENRLAFTSHEAMKEWLDETATDGEKFFVGFVADSAPYVKLTEIPVEEITNIVYSPDNWKIPVYYKRDWQPMKIEGDNEMLVPDGQPKTRYYLDYRITEEMLEPIKSRIKIKAEKLAKDDERIFHSMINPLWTKVGKRGISELYASREWFRVYKEFMENRAAINEAATSIAFQRKIKSGPTAVANFRNKFGGIPVGTNEENVTELNKLTRPLAGSVYDTNDAMNLEWMKTDTGAANAKEDGRSLLTAAGAGVGMFVHYFGEGGDANLATAQAMELPMVKTFEDWQEWVNNQILAMLEWAISVATDRENAKKQIGRISGNFPPLVSQDVVKYMTAWSQMTQNVAPGNRVVHREAIRGSLVVMGVPNVDALMAQIDAEEKALEIKREQDRQQMFEAMKNAPVVDENGNGNGKNPVRDGNGNVIPPDLKTVARGRPEPARAGPKAS